MILPSAADLFALVVRHPAVEKSLDVLRRGGRLAGLVGLTDPAKALVVAHLVTSLRRTVVLLVESNQHAELITEPLRYFARVLGGTAAPQVAALPAPDVLPWQELAPHPGILETRACALWRLSSGVASTVVAPLAAALMRYRDRAYYQNLARSIARDEDVSLEDLVAGLERVGYERQELVEMPGQFAVRGGIVDVFSPETARPVRIELLGDTVESLREFDPNTQRSVAPLERVTLLPLVEQLRGDGGESPGGVPGGTLFDLAAQPIVVLDEPDSLDEAAEKFRAHAAETYARGGREAGGTVPEAYFVAAAEWHSALETLPRLLLEQLPLRREIGSEEDAFELPTQPSTHYHGNVVAFMAEVGGRIRAGEQVMVSAASVGELERLAHLCHEYELPFRLAALDESASTARLAEDATSGSAPAVLLARAPLSAGVVFPESKVAIYGTEDLFETLPAAVRPQPRPRVASFFSDLSDLKAGDFVVHVDHGIGQFEGLRQLETDGARGEFMLLRYADEAKLYVPLARLDLVQRYRSLGGAQPQLDRLGGTAWIARKKRVRRSLTDMADQLIKLYAARKTIPGHTFSPDSPWQKEFEDTFEFEETPDQVTAIVEVKRDMERALPMDRLICGDVGYGKTEVAMRAAFKAVSDNKQVAVLAPTTVLAFQHDETFRRRFAAFPVRIEMLSRFRSAREQKEVLGAAEAGQVDVLVGTHRLLSRDVRFRDLGLMIVDEEQRFGVVHKERLKELRKHVDVLTLSATPIPRTLHMALVGLRDMSVIETPPKDRLAIQTIVAPFRESLVQRAIEEELAREGQVFFVHNRVESIYSLASLIARLVPRARVVVGHGQMREKELEATMLKFIRGEVDVLVSTTIVETGLDIPRANTIIINRADRFGLAELYHLRGRVGRSNRRAYAYLLVPPASRLSSLARRRLAALKEFSELGAGFKIAALDLELRGAGNLLGREQHGHISAIGFDLYCQMLERAVAELKGEMAAPELRATINLGLDIRIPPDYIPSESLRLQTYRRIAQVASESEREEARRELEDRFGPPPPAVDHLFDYALLKAMCERLLVAAVERQGQRLAVRFHPQTSVPPERLTRLVRASPGMRLDPSGVLSLEVPRGPASAVQSVRNVLLQLEA